MVGEIEGFILLLLYFGVLQLSVGKGGGVEQKILFTVG